MRAPFTQAAAVLAVAVPLALPAAAVANDFQDVYRDYKRTGTIKPCKFSNGKLRNAERQTPPDVEQYAPSFLDALQTARERGADCNRAAPAPAPQPNTPGSAAPTPSTPTPAPETTATPTAATPVPATTAPAPTVPAQGKVTGVASPPLERAAKEDETPTPVWLLALLAALVALFAVFAGLAWWFGWSADRFTRPWRASWGDFSGRLADAGSEFRDWVRTGQ